MGNASPLTAFLVNMLKADRAALVKADAGELAAKYGIRADYAAWYLRTWLAALAPASPGAVYP